MNNRIFKDLSADQVELVTDFLQRGDYPYEIYTINELEGFLFGTAITPGLSEEDCMDIVVGERVFDNDDEMRTITDIVLNSYRKLLYDFNNDHLRFPFLITPDNLDDELESTLQEWCRGFYYALHIRPDIWHLEYMKVDLLPPEEIFHFVFALQIIVNIAFAEDMYEMYEDVMKNPDDELAVLAYSYMKIGDVINAIIAFARNKDVDFSQILQEVKIPRLKIGRNDPCPCGSGKKYKHCCGKDK